MIISPDFSPALSAAESGRTSATATPFLASSIITPKEAPEPILLGDIGTLRLRSSKLNDRNGLSPSSRSKFFNKESRFGVPNDLNIESISMPKLESPKLKKNCSAFPNSSGKSNEKLLDLFRFRLTYFSISSPSR